MVVVLRLTVGTHLCWLGRTDPFRDMTCLLREVKELGFTGVQNFPTVGLIDGAFRQNLEETRMDYGKEVEMIRLAHEIDTIRFQRRRGGAHGSGWGGHHCRAHGTDDAQDNRCRLRWGWMSVSSVFGRSRLQRRKSSRR
ncbi:TIM-barrel signal transduction protein-domain-containing protein [Boletus edulis]|nr:TIM-barrel signal transduction protein-domain-containing protein [Boletus edulis]